MQSVLEVQARQALHEHYLLWTSLFPPSFLEKCAQHPRLVAAIATVLDSMVQAKLSVKAIEDRITRRIKVSEDDEKRYHDLYSFDPVEKLQRPCLLFRLGPLKDENYWEHVYDTQGYVGYHDEHALTCHKPPNGIRSCRLGMCQCWNDYGTRCIELDREENHVRVINQLVKIVTVEEKPPFSIIPPVRKMRFCHIGLNSNQPFPKPDERLLIWSLARPSCLVNRGEQGICYEGPASGVHERDRQCSAGSFQKQILYEKNINGHVVPYNDLLTYADGCNTAIYHLGSTEAAKVKAYYMTKYLIKDQGAFKKLLSIGSTAYHLTMDHPNVYVSGRSESNAVALDEKEVVDMENISSQAAETSCTILSEPTHSTSISSSRFTSSITNQTSMTAMIVENDPQSSNSSIPASGNLSDKEYKSIKRFGNTLLNSLRSTYERSAQESASKLLGYKASYSSINARFLFMKSAMEHT